jgi:DNA modification methylase
LEDLKLEKIIGHNRFDTCAICGGYILQNPDRPSACKCDNPVREDNKISGNFHPTVKPTSLMQYLCRLITPSNGIVIDPFMGSGSTGKACILEGFRFIGIEMEPDYMEIAKARIEYISKSSIVVEKHRPDKNLDELW